MTDSASWYRWAVTIYDRGYRLVHGLDRPDAEAGPVLRVERRHLRHALRLADGPQLHRGMPVGVLHLNNARALALHGDGVGPGAIGFAFCRLVLTSLYAIATQAADGGPLASLQAYSAMTLFHHGLPRLGFGLAHGDRPRWGQLVSGYERALLCALHPAGAARVRRGARGEARRLWMSRERLLALYRRDPVADSLERPRRARAGRPP